MGRLNWILVGDTVGLLDRLVGFRVGLRERLEGARVVYTVGCSDGWSVLLDERGR